MVSNSFGHRLCQSSSGLRGRVHARLDECRRRRGVAVATLRSHFRLSYETRYPWAAGLGQQHRALWCCLAHAGQHGPVLGHSPLLWRSCPLADRRPRIVVRVVRRKLLGVHVMVRRSEEGLPHPGYGSTPCMGTMDLRAHHQRHGKSHQGGVHAGLRFRAGRLVPVNAFIGHDFQSYH